MAIFLPHVDLMGVAEAAGVIDGGVIMREQGSSDLAHLSLLAQEFDPIRRHAGPLPEPACAFFRTRKARTVKTFTSFARIASPWP